MLLIFNSIQIFFDIPYHDLRDESFHRFLLTYTLMALHIGSHGDGHPTNTNTPLVAWGAAIRSPRLLPHNSQSHYGPTPAEWGLSDVERIDVNQADIAPLMV